MSTNLLPQICKTCLGKGFVVIPICDCDGVKYEKHRCLDCASVCENKTGGDTAFSKDDSQRTVGADSP